LSFLKSLGKYIAICGLLSAAFGEVLVILGTVDLGSSLLTWGILGCIGGCVVYGLFKEGFEGRMGSEQE